MRAELLLPLALIGAAAAYGQRGRPHVPTAVALATLLLCSGLVLLTPAGWTGRALGVDLGLSALSRLLLLASFGLASLIVLLADAFPHSQHDEAVVLTVVAAAIAVSFSVGEPLVPVYSLALVYLLISFLSGQHEADVSGRVPELAYFTIIGIGVASLVVAFTLVQAYTVSRDPVLVRLIVPLMGIGFAILLGAFPFHLWLPGVFLRGSFTASALLVSVACLASLGLLARTISSYPWLLLNSRGGELLLMGGLMGGLVCPAIAIWQKGLARTLVYLAIGNTGLVLVGLALGTEESMEAALWIAVSQALAMLLVIVGVRLCEPGRRQAEWRPAADRRSRALALIAVGGVAMIGLPPLAAFPGKWELYQAAAGNQPLLAALLLAGALATAALARIIWQAIQASEPALSGADDSGLPARQTQIAAVGVASAMAAALALGAFPSPLLTAISIAVQHLSLPF